MSSRLWVSQATMIGMIGRLGIRPYSPDPGAASVWRKVLIRLGSAPGLEARTARPAATRHDFPGPQVIDIYRKFTEIKHPPEIRGCRRSLPARAARRDRKSVM